MTAYLKPKLHALVGCSKLTVPAGPVMKCFFTSIPPNSKLEKTAKLHAGWLINLQRFTEHDLIMCESKVHVVVFLES